MNKNIFDSLIQEELYLRIDKLQENSIKLWGKMTVDQMLIHCQVPFKIGLSKAPIKQMFFGKLFGKYFLKQILSDKPIKKNAPTSKEFIVTGKYDLEESKQKLKKYIKLFTSQDSKYYDGKVHPFFGKMTSEQWGILEYKHLDHHLSQFSC